MRHAHNRRRVKPQHQIVTKSLSLSTYLFHVVEGRWEWWAANTNIVAGARGPRNSGHEETPEPCGSGVPDLLGLAVVPVRPLLRVRIVQ